MADFYDPQIEENDDDGYSIPKILVAVLLLVLVGAGGFIMVQNKKVKAMFQTFEQQKKSIESDLDQMVLKYNLAIEDNGSLSNELKTERDKIIRFRDSIKKIKGNENSISIEEYNNALKKLKESSSIVFDDSKKSSTINPEKIEPSKQTVNEVATPSNSANSQNKQDETSKEVVNEQPNTEATSTVINGPQTFERVEVPPTYPGCKGDETQKKACFSAQVKKAIADKFDPELLGNLNLPSGNQRVMVTFTVNKFGNISNISATGPHKKMEAEAVKATKSLPKMSPARQNGVPVDITFKIPISFKIK
jgi:TonB family protein